MAQASGTISQESDLIQNLPVLQNDDTMQTLLDAITQIRDDMHNSFTQINARLANIDQQLVHLNN